MDVRKNRIGRITLIRKRNSVFSAGLRGTSFDVSVRSDDDSGRTYRYSYALLGHALTDDECIEHVLADLWGSV